MSFLRISKDGKIFAPKRNLIVPNLQINMSYKAETN